MRNKYMAGKPKWNGKNYALKRISNYIKNNNNTLIGVTKDSRWNTIRQKCNEYNYNIEDLCKELGYDYWKLKGRELPINYFENYDVLKNTIKDFINTYDRFPTIKELKHNYNVPPTVITKHGGINKIKDDLEYTKDDLVDDLGFRNRSHYEYIVAQFLIHNDIRYTREEHPFPEPYQNLRSDFTFYISDSNVYHVEVWGYSKEDGDGKRSKQYCKKKKEKIKLYEKYRINLISIENEIFSNTFDTIQKKLSSILSPILKQKFKIIDHSFLVNPNKMSDDELFNEIMKLSNDGVTLPKESDFNETNKYLFLEALKRFGNYGNFAKRYGVCTNSKRGYWNRQTIFDRLDLIHDKYGYLPTSIEIRKNKLAKQDSLFIGIVDAIKKFYPNTIQAYLEYYEYCANNGIVLHEHDTKYLNNLYNLMYFRKDQVTEHDRERAYAILCA